MYLVVKGGDISDAATAMSPIPSVSGGVVEFFFYTCVVVIVTFVLYQFLLTTNQVTNVYVCVRTCLHVCAFYSVLRYSKT